MDLGSMATSGVASILSGGALGAIGAIGTGVLDFFKTKQRNAQELAVMGQQLELLKASGNNQEKLEGIKLIASSYDADKATYGDKPGMVDTVRGLTRPLLTAYLVLISTILALWAFHRVTFDATIMDIAKYSVALCLETTGTAVVWWFGGREIRKSKIG